jgi:hypothetical protein
LHNWWADELESAEGFTIEDAHVTQWEDLVDPEHISPTSVPVYRVVLAADEQRERQAESLQRFQPS